jgi:hypothetical protein
LLKQSTADGTDWLNGELIAAAEAEGFEILLTTEKTYPVSKTCKPGRSRLWSWAISNCPLCAATWKELWPL